MVLNVVGSNPTGHPEETDFISVSFFCGNDVVRGNDAKNSW